MDISLSAPFNAQTTFYLLPFYL